MRFGVRPLRLRYSGKVCSSQARCYCVLIFFDCLCPRACVSVLSCALLRTSARATGTTRPWCCLQPGAQRGLFVVVGRACGVACRAAMQNILLSDVWVIEMPFLPRGRNRCGMRQSAPCLGGCRYRFFLRRSDFVT